MKAKIVQRPAPPPHIVLRVNEREALILRALLGGVACIGDNEASKFVRKAFGALDVIGDETSTETFSTFFKGSIEVRS